jgi:signal peptidase I
MVWQSPDLQKGAIPGRYRPSRDNWGPLIVPSERYFVLGDNRDNSEDSRYWGFITRESIKGRPWRVYYSTDQAHAGVLSWLQDVRWERIGGLIE